MPGHEARLANDGNPATGWQAANALPGAWWQIDLESVNSITSVETTFGDAANYRYKIEASPDGNTWTMLSDQTGTASTARVRTDACAKNARNRYLRLTITGLPSNEPALVNEIRVFAEPSS
jgi:alpha-L-fucosidase